MNFVCRVCGTSQGFPGRCDTHGQYLLEEDSLARAPEDKLLGTLHGGKYALIGILGQGAFGNVYRAWQVLLDRQVAIKLIRRSKSRGTAFRERFFLEARAVARLSGPNIVTLHDFGEEADGRLYMVLELVEGPTLRQAVPAGTRIAPDRAIRMALPVLRALSHAHAQGIVHRDIKPTNLMLTLDDEGQETVKVLDFGVAKFLDIRAEADRMSTDTSLVVGTPRYIAPEQAAGKTVGPTTDLYSLGVILWEQMSGRPPFEAATPQDVANKRVYEPAPPLPDDVNASPELRALLARVLERDVSERPPNAAALAAALRSTPEIRGVESEPSAPPMTGFAVGPTVLYDRNGDAASQPSASGVLFSDQASLSAVERPRSWAPAIAAAVGAAILLIGAVAIFNRAGRPDSPVPAAGPPSVVSVAPFASPAAATASPGPIQGIASIGPPAPPAPKSAPASHAAPATRPRAPASRPAEATIPYL